MAEWYDVSSEELSEHIARCLSTTMYSSRITTHDISGEYFFSMADPDVLIFFDLVGMTWFQHKVKLRRWWSDCKEYESIIIGPQKLAPKKPSRDNTVDCTGTHCQSRQEECLASEEPGKANNPVKKEPSREDSEPVRLRKPFYPTPDEIFNVNCKAQVRSLLAQYHKEALEAHKENFRIVRSWFAQYDTNQEQHEYLHSDFKSNTDIKERCQRYMRSRMKELVPLKFVCPETGAEHKIPWPEPFVFDVVKNRRHEWKKTTSRKRKREIASLRCEDQNRMLKCRERIEANRIEILTSLYDQHG